ncbi:hypothetical protein QBC34DRAFT_426814 [Podospora aff. communis PSN243]|uniref:Clr5 domain-containing protein n=1 Tax=Podospora aff. communis PSN243 TaxID=3040156 RepID=A0AAV9GII8_9PEZI|nr:hypothetical protein QBC34DRAFT_426814 [Podospora aff. communis PSN243]
MTDSTVRFRHSDGSGRSTNRIPEEKWEEYKDIILEKYKKGTLQLVREEMKAEYDFDATTRQLVHHIGTVWRVKKYNTRRNNASSSSQPNETTPQANSESISTTSMPDTGPDNSLPKLQPPSEYGSPQHRLLASILFATGDPAAFHLYNDLCQLGPSDELLSDLIACTRAAQTTDAVKARETLQMHVDDILNGHDDDSSLATLVDFQAARTYDFASDKNNALGQIEQRILSITIDVDSQAQLKSLPRRDRLRLDIPLYDYLCYALKRWNEPKIGPHGAMILESMNEEAILAQLVSYQLGSDKKLSCLDLCLEWCINILENNPPIPQALVDPKVSHIDPVEAAYQVVGTLWEYVPKSSTSDTHLPAWIELTKTELGIPPAELFVNIICMAMPRNPTVSIPSNTVIKTTRHSLTSLTRLKSKDLLDRFLQQVRLNNDSRMFSTGVFDATHLASPTPSIYQRFRHFVFNSFNLEPSVDYPNAYFHPPVLGDHPNTQFQPAAYAAAGGYVDDGGEFMDVEEAQDGQPGPSGWR